jgi:hypothetical protein
LTPFRLAGFPAVASTSFPSWGPPRRRHQPVMSSDPPNVLTYRTSAPADLRLGRGRSVAELALRAVVTVEGQVFFVVEVAVPAVLALRQPNPACIPRIAGSARPAHRSQPNCPIVSAWIATESSARPPEAWFPAGFLRVYGCGGTRRLVGAQPARVRPTAPLGASGGHSGTHGDGPPGVELVAGRIYHTACAPIFPSPRPVALPPLRRPAGAGTGGHLSRR